MSGNKRGRPTESLKDYMLRVRLNQEEIKMLDFLCERENLRRSQMIRQLIIGAIRTEFATWFDENPEMTYFDITAQQHLIRDLEEDFPLIDEIDVNTNK